MDQMKVDGKNIMGVVVQVLRSRMVKVACMGFSIVLMLAIVYRMLPVQATTGYFLGWRIHSRSSKGCLVSASKKQLGICLFLEGRVMATYVTAGENVELTVASALGQTCFVTQSVIKEMTSVAVMSK